MLELTIFVLGYALIGALCFYLGIRFIKKMSRKNYSFDGEDINMLVIWGFALWPGGLIFALAVGALALYGDLTERLMKKLNKKD